MDLLFPLPFLILGDAAFHTSPHFCDSVFFPSWKRNAHLFERGGKGKTGRTTNTHKHILSFIELVLHAEATLQCLLLETHTD